MRPFALALALAGLASACANPINLHTGETYYQAGARAEDAGDFALAATAYERALWNFRMGSAPDEHVAAALYGLGRMKGLLCAFDDAETYLEQSLAIAERLSGPGSVAATQRRFELARLHLDRGDPAGAVPHYERAIPAVRALGLETEDPIALADALGDFARALEGAGDGSRAASVRDDADSVRAAWPGRTADFVPVRYDRTCPE